MDSPQAQGKPVEFNIQIGDELTQNVMPLMHEIRHALRQLIETGETSIIDLRSIPLAPGEESTLLEQLGTGEVQVTINAMGPSEITETRYTGVWLVSHYNEERSILGRFIEITRAPEILLAQQEDMALSLQLLENDL